MKSRKERTNKNTAANEFLEKMKENNKLFEEKMNSLNKKKIKVIKSNKSKSKSKKKEIKKEKKETVKLTIKKDVQINFDGEKKKKIPKFIIINEYEMTILNRNKNRNKRLKIDNCISFRIISTIIKNINMNVNENNYTEEEQDIYFISKIRQLQKDLKYKSDLIMDLQDKIKEKDDKYVKMTRDELNELYDRLKNSELQKEEKLKQIQKLETVNYNQKVIIENLQAQIGKLKKESKLKKDDINELNIVIDKLKYDEDSYAQKINRLEILNKNSVKNFEILRDDLEKVKNEKKRLEKIIEEQRVKMDKDRSHINTLRKFICEDEKTLNRMYDDKLLDFNDNVYKKVRIGGRNKSQEVRKYNTQRKNRYFDNDENKDYNGNKYYNDNEDYNDNNDNKNFNDNENQNYNQERNKDNGINGNANENEKNNDDRGIISSFEYKTKSSRKNKLDLSQDLNQDFAKKKKKPKSLKKSKSRKKDNELTVSSFKNRIKRTFEDENEDNKDIFYNTFSNLNDLNTSTNKDNNNLYENELGYFPCEQHLLGKKNEIKKLEAELDVLLKEKNDLENEIVKMPEHPKTLQEIKNKKIMNDKLALAESNLNKVRTKIRKIKET